MPPCQRGSLPIHGSGGLISSPFKSADTIGLSQDLLGCHPRDGTFTHPWDGGIREGRKHNSLENASLQIVSFQESILQGQIFIILSGVVLGYTLYRNWSSRRVQQYTAMHLLEMYSVATIKTRLTRSLNPSNLQTPLVYKPGPPAPGMPPCQMGSLPIHESGGFNSLPF